MKKEIKYSKRTKDKSLVGKVKETIMQVSHSKKWKSQKALDNEGNEILNDKGKPVLIKSYSLLQDRFYKYMSDNGYKDFIRGEKGSTAEHLSDLEYKAKKEKEKLQAITDKVKQQQTKFIETTSAIEDSEKRKSQAQQDLNEIKKDIDNYKGYKGDIDNIDVGKSKLFGKKVELDNDDYQNLVKYAKKGIVADIEIAKLKEDGIMTPTEYYQSLGRKSPTKVQEVKNFWNADTVNNILNSQEYIGDTVNFRSTQRSFKDHTKIDLPKEEWKIFKNHHEPIIDEETWNTVQRIRNSKRRPTKTGKQSIFSGHLFCKDCGAKLYYCTANNFTADKDFYRCSNYKNNSTNACTSHNIKDIALRQIVLEQVQQVVSYIHNFEGLFIKEKQNASIEEHKAQIVKDKKQLTLY